MENLTDLEMRQKEYKDRLTTCRDEGDRLVTLELISNVQRQIWEAIQENSCYQKSYD